jgi:hypothetical protein
MKNLSATTPLEPFVETLRAHHACRIGYRDQDGETVSEVVVPTSLLTEALYFRFSIDLRLSADGFVSASLSESTDSPTAPRTVSAIDDLLRATLTSRNLHLEEASAGQLRSLLNRLEDSVGLLRKLVDQSAI